MTDPDPKKYLLTGVSPGGGGTTHIDLGDIMRIESPQSRLFVLVVTLSALADYAERIRDQHPAVFKEVSVALTAGTAQVTRAFQNGVGLQG
jgi:hypothetical protein